MSVKFFQPQALRKYNPPEKYSTTYDADTYVFHINQIYKAPKKTNVDSKIKQLLIWKTITGKWTSGEFELEHDEFIVAFLNLEFTLFNMITYIDIMQYAGGSGIMVFLLLSLIIPVPLIIYYTFISMYSRTGFIKFWDSVPIAQGFAYSYILYKTIMCVIHAPICGMFLWYFFKVISKNPMRTGRNIARFAITSDMRKFGCESIIHNISAYGSISHFRRIFNYKYELPTERTFHHWWLLTVAIWIVIYITMLCSFRRIYKMLHKINVCLLVVVFILITLYIIYINRNFEFKVFIETDFSNPQLWVRVGAILLRGVLPGTYMTFATVTKPGFMPEVGVLWIYLLLALLYTATSVLAAIVQEQIHWVYGGGTKCHPRFSGIEMVVAIFPELVTLKPFGGYLILIYFAGLMYWCVCSLIYTLHGLLETLLMTYPKLTKYRLFICTGLFVCATVLTISIIVSNTYFSIFIAINENGALFYTYFMATLMVLSILIYSTRRFENDYYFDYSRRVHPCVIFGIQLSIIFSIVMVILYMLYGIPRMDFSSLLNVLANFMIFACISPVFIYLGLSEYQNRGEKMYSLLKPAPFWGPANQDRKQSRRRCDPAREFKYRIDLPCTHMCLQDSKWLNSEKEFWVSRLQHFTSLQKMADEYEKEFTPGIKRRTK